MEPLIRQAARRALAEHEPASGSFNRADWWGVLVWKLQALLTSRTFEDVAFDRTRRFRVEEIFLFGRGPLELLSFASRDPFRHANHRKIAPTVRRLAAILEDRQPAHGSSIPLEKRLAATVWHGPGSVMVAIVRGTLTERHATDLGLVHSQAARWLDRRPPCTDRPLIWDLQSILEDGLLISAPAIL
jgi:hypothetical protein